ncbi:uncharacterized protein LOC129005903 [Macrosteles quadrilineatus]|uniref:uncharacterized protein LOC129005903 n=1 Tax=Macrosteles quadrilineatus TaxID=74068 RepID=UPI0023E28F94|nr:uncharacterized protein LOC129005903 [Macrosteles quadrilineatus]
MSANSSDSEEFSGNQQVLKAISGLKTDLQQILDTKLEGLEDKISSKLEVSLASIRTDINSVKLTFQESVDTLKNDNDVLKEKCKQLEDSLEKSTSDLQDLKSQMRDMQQYSRLSNIEIVGVPLTKNENIYAILEKVANSIDVPWLRTDISVAHRLPSSRKDRHPNIVVRFISRSTRAAWLTAAREKRGLDAVHLSSVFTPSQIFINEHLTAHTRAVLNEAKKMVSKQQLAFAWVREGRVLVRVTEKGRPRRVGDIGDLQLLVRGPRSSPNNGESHTSVTTE